MKWIENGAEADQLAAKGISPEKLTFAFCRIGESESELHDAMQYIQDAGYSIGIFAPRLSCPA